MTTTAAPIQSPVTLVEELILLGIEDDGSIAYTASTPGFAMAVIGGCLVQLNTLGFIDADLTSVQVLRQPPTGDKSLDMLLAEIAQGSTASIDQWVIRLYSMGGEVIQDKLDSLVARGILAQQDRRFLWVLKERRYPMQHDGEQREAKRRICDTLMSNDVPTPHDTVLVGLASACGLLEAFLSKGEIARLDGRIREAGGIDLIVRGVESAMLEEENLRALAMMHPMM